MTLTLTATLEQKHPGLAAFIVVPTPALAPWALSATTTVEGTVDGVELGRRSLIRWDEDRWFIEPRRETLAAVDKHAGDRITLVLRLASAELPAELQAVLDQDAGARARWEAFSAARQRMLREEVLAAKAPATRERRARRALAPCERLAAVSPAAMPALPRELLARITGGHFPGTVCGPYADIRVGLAQRDGSDLQDTVVADAIQAVWETRITVQDRNGAVGFAGPAVHGPPAERFLYLTWVGRRDGAGLAMFRRAKLRLDAVPAEVLAAALRDGVLMAQIGLTDRDGMPVCGSVRPPAITWSGGARTSG